VKDIKWREVRVGHVLRVDDEELFPADLLCLFSALPDNACFIKTTNLDGESNLKIRRPVDLREAAPSEESDVMQIRATLECEPPNANLHKFQGRLLYKDGSAGARITSGPTKDLSVSLSLNRTQGIEDSRMAVVHVK
jgi:magnesium-transporting ATPase (P-type)